VGRRGSVREAGPGRRGPRGCWHRESRRGGGGGAPGVSPAGRPLLVRQVPREGLSCRLWPAALGLCAFLERCCGPGAEGAGRRVRGRAVPARPWQACALWRWARARGWRDRAACLGADVLLTDLPAALPFLAANVRLNAGAVSAGQGSARVQQLPLARPRTRGQRLWAPWTLSWGPTCVYHEHLFEPLVATLLRLSRPLPHRALPRVPREVPRAQGRQRGRTRSSCGCGMRRCTGLCDATGYPLGAPKEARPRQPQRGAHCTLRHECRRSSPILWSRWCRDV